MSVLHKIENLGKRVFAGNPAIKRTCKRAYQLGMYAISPKLKCEGSVRAVTPQDGEQYFFGYYDKSPWDASNRYMLCLRAAHCDAPAPNLPAELLLIDTQNASSIEVLGRTHAWNVQQGCMLQWLGPDYKSRILFNDFREGRYCSVIYDMATRSEIKTLPMAVYTVSSDGKTALSADFSRLHRLRPGYGYSNLPDETESQPIPDSPCVWRMDLESGEVTPILKYTDLAAFEPRPEMTGAVHKINHLMINPSGTRFMALHRWFVGQKKFTRLITCDMDGQNLYNLSDDDFVSHCNWLDDQTILSYCRRRGQGDGYYQLTDLTGECKRRWSGLDTDGHMSLSPDGKRIVTDTYPNQRRVSTVYVMHGDSVQPAAKVFSPFRYDGDLRCDLHPRWSRDGKIIAFDSTHDGKRGLYIVPAPDMQPVQSGKKQPLRVLELMTIPMIYDGPNQFALRFVKHMDRKHLRADFLSYRLGDERIRADVEKMGGEVFIAPNRLKKPFGYIRYVSKLVRRNGYDVVHAHGNSCTLAIDLLAAKLGGAKVRIAHSHNSRCKFMALHKALRLPFDRLYTHALACGEEAGRWLFGKHSFKVIPIAIDAKAYAFDADVRRELREEFGFSDATTVLGSVAHFTPHKNHSFLIAAFAEALKRNPDLHLVLVGDGGLRPEAELKARNLGIADHVHFLGLRMDVPHLLQMMDAMVLPSLFEGFPTVAMEWQCAGLPVLMADNITRDCAFIDCVDYLPLEMQNWVDAMLSVPQLDRAEASREGVEAITRAGYDLTQAAADLEADYRSFAQK